MVEGKAAARHPATREGTNFCDDRPGIQIVAGTPIRRHSRRPLGSRMGMTRISAPRRCDKLETVSARASQQDAPVAKARQDGRYTENSTQLTEGLSGDIPLNTRRSGRSHASQMILLRSRLLPVPAD